MDSDTCVIFGDDKYRSLNKDLCAELERVFKPLGVIAFTRCCGTCTDTYAEDEDFELREDGGVHFIRLHLEGMSYEQRPDDCYAMYADFEYLMNNWDKEYKMLTQFCRIVTGNKQNDTGFRIEKPKDETEAVCIFFDEPLNLDPPIE
jgi:type IV secretory pathway VirJ component